MIIMLILQYNMIRTTIMMITQTVGPILTISLLTVVTEYKVQASLKARRTYGFF